MKKAMYSVVLAALMLLIGINVSAQNVAYTVKAGDTLYKISQQYGTSFSDIMAVNPLIKSPSSLYVGEVLSIPASTISTFESEVIRLVNVQRTNRGLKALGKSVKLCNIARIKSQDMINSNYFSHTSPRYGSPFNMMENMGVQFMAAGENIAMGQTTPAQVMNSWMNSPGHRANILSVAYSQIGVGLAKNKNGVCYWTQEFINPMY